MFKKSSADQRPHLSQILVEMMRDQLLDFRDRHQIHYWQIQGLQVATVPGAS
jgi:hypothetical protein